MSMRGATIEERIKAHSVPEGNCVVWTGALVHDGYGRIKVNGKTRRVHRVAWELVNGQLGADMVIDHICCNRRCLKLEHLRQVAASENNARRQINIATNKTGYRGVHSRPDGKWRATWRLNGKTRDKNFQSIPEAAVHAASKRLDLYPLKDEEDRRLVELYGPIMLSNLPELEQPYAMSATQNEEESPNDQ